MSEDAPTVKIDAPPPSGPPAQPRDATVVAEQPRDATVIDAPTVQPPVVADPLAAASAGFGKRGALRRQLRRLRNARADQLVRLGTLVLDARKRSNGSQPEVVTRRAAEVAEIDRQVSELSYAVDPHADRRPVASGVAGSCRECGALLSTEDNFCAQCGTPVNPKRARPDSPPAEGVAEMSGHAAQIGHSPVGPPPTPGTAQAPAAPPPPPPPSS